MRRTEIKTESREAEQAALAHEIAADDAVETIANNLNAVRDRRGRVIWFDLASVDEYSRWLVERAVRYLDLCGLLRRHATRPKYINWRRA